MQVSGGDLDLVREATERGIWVHFMQCSGAVQLENIASALFCFGVIGAAWSRMFLEPLEDVCLTVSALALWFYVLWFLLGWRFTGPFVVMLVSPSPCPFSWVIT